MFQGHIVFIVVVKMAVHSDGDNIDVPLLLCGCRTKSDDNFITELLDPLIPHILDKYADFSGACLGLAFTGYITHLNRGIRNRCRVSSLTSLAPLKPLETELTDIPNFLAISFMVATESHPSF